MKIIPSTYDLEKEIYEVKIDFDDLIISKDEVELTLGYSKGKIPEHFSNIISEIFLQLHNRCEIKAGYRICDVEKFFDNRNGLYIEDRFFTFDKIITAQIRKSEKAALFVCTIGSAMEGWAKEMNSVGDFTTAYIIDTVASITVESAVDILHDHIESQMLYRGMKITNRYSPGYCNWNVSEQHLLFSLLPQKFCGITLTESALMLPVKSISGIIGIGSNVKYSKYACDRCGVRDCTHRAYRLLENKKIRATQL